MCRRIHSFVWGGLAAVALIVVGIVTSINTSDFTNLAIWGALGVMAYTLIGCLILDNNFVGEKIEDILEWGFVKMPGLIFTLDLDGIVWLLTVKLLFWILNLILSIICGVLAIAFGLVVSLFVYPYAIRKSFKTKNPM